MIPFEVTEPPTNSVARRAGSSGRPAGRDADVAGEERVDVAGDERDVLGARRGDVVEELRALGRVAVPLVLVDLVARRAVEGHDHRLVGDDLPGGPRRLQPALEPLLLRLAEVGAPGRLGLRARA
jgi:hypothetical protein